MRSRSRERHLSEWPAPRDDLACRWLRVAGRLQLGPVRLREAGIATAWYALTELEPDLDRCIANASPLLRRVGTQIAKDWLA
jgi:hypothetical protein